MSEAAQMTQEQLESALAMLRRQNVSKYTDTPGGGFTVEFFPPAPPADNAKPSNDPDICPGCKHPQFMHMNGACTQGCDNCEPEEKKA